MAREIWERDTHGQYSTTWTSPGGDIRRKIGYIMIDAKHRSNDEEGEEQYLLACQHGPEPTSPSTNDASLLQRITEIQEADTSRNRGATKI